VINRLSSSSISFDTLYHLIFQKLPDYHFFKVLGCCCYLYTRPYMPNKLSPRSFSCIFLGYSTTYKGYKCHNLRNNKIFFSRHIIFDETCFTFKNYTSQSSPSSSPYTLSPLVVLQPTTLPESSQNISNNESSAPQSILPLSTSPTLLTLPVTPPPIRVYHRRHNTTSAAATVPSSDSVVSTHYMLTRSKTAKTSTIPKALLATNHYTLEFETDPTSYTQASKISH
jgi:hypothetical protein